MRASSRDRQFTTWVTPRSARPVTEPAAGTPPTAMRSSPIQLSDATPAPSPDITGPATRSTRAHQPRPMPDPGTSTALP